MKIYEDYKLVNVYIRNYDLRIKVYLRNIKTNEIIRMSYPKYLMECHLNRYLNEDETVDHIDKNPLNNIISNLQVLKRKEHNILDAKRVKECFFICPICNKKFSLSKGKLNSVLFKLKQIPNYTGPYCSKKCMYISQTFKNKEKSKYFNNIKKEYYTLKEEKYEIKPRIYTPKNYHLEYLDTENKKYFLSLCKEYFGEDDILVNNFEDKFSANIIIKSIKLAIIWDNYIFFPETKRFDIINDYCFHLKNISEAGFYFYIPIEKEIFDFLYCNTKFREIIKKYKLSKEKFNNIIEIYNKNYNKDRNINWTLNKKEKIFYWINKIKEITKDNENYNFKTPLMAHKYYMKIKFYYSDQTQERINKILNSDIDFSKFGWVKKVSELTGITHQKVNQFMIRNMFDFYKEKCFKRKC